MDLSFNNNIKIFAEASPSVFGAELLSIELKARNIENIITDNQDEADICFVIDESIDRDSYKIKINNSAIYFYASGKRGFIYAYGHLLRKMTKAEKGFSLPDVSGYYCPEKAIRGHQIGYRTTPNTYDAWSYEDYRKYSLEMMYFGANTVEHIPYQTGVSKRNRLMKYDEEEFLVEASKMADKYDLNVSLWHPNYDNETHESAAKRRGELYSKLKRLDYVFIPGGDPGELPADVFVDRCIEVSKALKKVHPEAQMWPSAQMPHDFPNWAETFISKLSAEPDEIDGIIYGPNHAMPIDELYDKLPKKYPLRFYPDITHNVRCEYPVHFEKQDWHYALTTGLSRECTNPRPREYAHLYDITKDFFVGSVSYSEGITDDVNKAVFSALDFDSNQDVEDIIKDYCRLHFYGADTDKIASLIFALENNWVGDPSVNDSIENTYTDFSDIYCDYPILQNNWRFLQLVLRADCDMLIRYRMLLDYDAIDECEDYLLKDDFDSAVKALDIEYSRAYKMLRDEIDDLAKQLFELIGLQTDVEHYCADSWERGAILETIDLPVTDRIYYLNKSKMCKNAQELLSYFNRNIINAGEFYYSVAYNGLPEKQDGELYMNFRGDNPDENNGNLPTNLFNIYDNQSFNMTIDKLDSSRDYTLRVTYLNKKDDAVDNLKITANDHIVYCGKQFGEIDKEYTDKFCTPKYVTARYFVPKEYIENNSIRLTLSEPKMCVMFAELSLKFE